MLEMLKAHGLDAGATQRPLTAGALSGLLADLLTLAVLHPFGSLDRLAAADQAPVVTVALLHVCAMTVAGAAYGLLFRRAANDPRGGWLFGMAYGYLLWQAVAVPLLQWLPQEALLQGPPALGLWVGQLLWGLLLGLGFRWVHRPLQSGLEQVLHGAEAGGGR